MLRQHLLLDFTYNVINLQYALLPSFVNLVQQTQIRSHLQIQINGTLKNIVNSFPAGTSRQQHSSNICMTTTSVLNMLGNSPLDSR